MRAHGHNMARKKALVSKQPSEPETSKGRKKKQQSQDSPTTLEELQRIKETGKQQHLQSEATQNAYKGQVDRGRKWLQDLVARKETINLTKEDEVLLKDRALKDAFGDVPNHLSSRVLAWYLAWKGFCTDKPVGRSTIESIHAAFKKLWEQASVLIT